MESLVISLLLFGVLVFLAWVFVKGIANMEPDGAAAGGFMILILIPVFIIVLIVFLWYTISSGGGLYLVLAILVLVLAALIPWNALFISTYTLQSLKKQSPGELRQLFHKYPRLFEATYRSSIRDDPEIVYQAIVSAPWNYQFISERLRSDANFALRSIEANPDVIEHFSSTIRNHPSIAELMDRREFVLEVIDPEDADSGRYDWSGCLNKDSRRLKYLPEHWRSDKEVMLLAIDIALGKCGSVSDGGEHDSMFLSGLDDLFSLIPEDLPRGLIHGDLSPVNVIGRKGKVLALLDLEEICAESFALDLAMTFVHFGWKDGLPVTDSWDALLAGYQSIRLLTAAEHASLPALHRYSILALAAWRYSEYVIKNPGTELTKRYIEMVDRLDKQLPF